MAFLRTFACAVIQEAISLVQHASELIVSKHLYNSDIIIYIIIYIVLSFTRFSYLTRIFVFSFSGFTRNIACECGSQSRREKTRTLQELRRTRQQDRQWLVLEVIYP